MSDGKGKEVLERILGNLASYADYHFTAEETEMVKYKYPDYEAHRGKHQAMLGKVGALIEDY
ncbi:MAG: Bacteriohemerythrin [Candidatus Scalindua arabica]|uniref:Bacteriohemerythrin n=1 Tax=Candidatus Scalindua arabica TaxID=1127984 RepID=A0A942A5N5_9BACT|nr:Bacteriohemerythrin [Candidatus Scalindua arabica]